MIVNFQTHTNGKGLWTEEKRMVIINRVVIAYSNQEYYPEDTFYGELRAYFPCDGFSVGSWNTTGHGLIYTDKLWLREFKKSLRELGLSDHATRDIDYSEQGMQGDDYVSMDVGPKFYASWKRLIKRTEGK